MATNTITFAPMVKKNKPIDMLMVYPDPAEDSPVNLVALSILFPGAMFEEKGMRVEYVDLRYDSWDMMEQLMRDSAQVGVSAFTGKQCSRAADVLERAKQIDKKIVTNVGGHHVRLCEDDVKKEGFVDVTWPERIYGEDLFPWSKAAQRIWKMGDMQYITSTGCPYGCAFCCLRSGWTPRPLDKIEREIGLLYDLTGFTEVSLTDPNMGFYFTRTNGVNERVDSLARIRAIGRIFNKYNIRYDCNIRGDYVTPELVDAMASGGCFSVEFGAESGNDYFLRHVVRKGHGTQDILNANRHMHGSGISVMNSFVRGMPHETHDQWLDTMGHIDNIMSIAPEARASVYKYVPYPGADSYKDAIAGNGIAKFTPPMTMRGWGSMPLMVDAVYWAAGMCFRLDNTEKNFPGDDWALIEPYVMLARKLWKERRPEDFPGEECEKLIVWQVRKHNAQAA